jgi:hypothetical protein
MADNLLVSICVPTYGQEKYMKQALDSILMQKTTFCSACFGDMSMFSFRATKVFNTIEGGAVCFADDDNVQLQYSPNTVI